MPLVDQERRETVVRWEMGDVLLSRGKFLDHMDGNWLNQRVTPGELYITHFPSNYVCAHPPPPLSPEGV